MSDARPSSIRQNLLASLLWATLAWGVITPLVLFLTVRHEINELLDDALRSSAEALVSVVQQPVLLQSAIVPLNEPIPGDHTESGGVLRGPVGSLVRGRFVWQLVDGADRVVLRSPQAPQQPLQAQHQAGFSESEPVSGDAWRVLGVRLANTDRMLYVAHSHMERHEALQDTIESTLWAGLGVWLCCLCLVYWRMRSEVGHLGDLVSAVQLYDPFDSAKSLPPASREEFAPIRDAIVELGRRLSVRMRNERAFTAHAAHALRTPLAGMDIQLAVALRECTPQQRPRLQRVREAATRFSRVVNALLTLFRSGSDLHWQPVDVAGLLSRLPVSGLEVVWDERCAESGPVWADPDLLAAALANVLDNAIRHGASRLRVGVWQVPGPHPIRISFQDNGPGISAEQAQKLQTALDQEDYEQCSGLGLMLVDLIARAHGGRLQLHPPAMAGEMVDAWSGLQADIWLAEPLLPPTGLRKPV